MPQMENVRTAVKDIWKEQEWVCELRRGKETDKKTNLCQNKEHAMEQGFQKYDLIFIH